VEAVERRSRYSEYLNKKNDFNHFVFLNKKLNTSVDNQPLKLFFLKRFLTERAEKLVSGMDDLLVRKSEGSLYFEITCLHWRRTG
jgi:hypothetical protein